GRSAAKETAPVKPVSDTVFEATLAEIGSPQVRAMLQLIRLTGSRPGEVCIMRTADIDRTASPWKYEPQTHKTAYKGHERVVYIGPRAQAVLADWLRADPEAFLFQPREAAAAVREAAQAAGRSDADRARAARNKRGPPMPASGAGGPQGYRTLIALFSSENSFEDIVAPSCFESLASNGAFLH
ncbi:MAG: hypothetical protein ACKOEX_13520, partial [Planctomycetia bacterium]